MPFGGPGTEPRLDPFQGSLGKGDLWQQDQNLGLGIGGQHGGRPLHVDLGLARTGYPIEQRNRKACAHTLRVQGVQRGTLTDVELGTGTGHIRLLKAVGRGDRLYAKYALVA